MPCGEGKPFKSGMHFENDKLITFYMFVVVCEDVINAVEFL